MNAIKLQVEIPKSRELNITLPDEVPVGAAEVIILSPSPTTTGEGVEAWLSLIEQWRANHPGRRSQADIDRYLEDERASWDRPR